MSDSYSLLCYTRVPTSREEANNEDIAFSVHLALRSHLDGSWTPLNENYGIFFAAGVPIAAATPNPDVRAPRRHDSRPIRTRRCEPPATPSRTARRCPAWTSNSKASRILTCSGWRPAGSPWRRPAPRAAAARTDRTVGVPAGDQPRPDVVRSARTGAAWPHVRRTPSHGHIQRCRTSVRHPVA